MQSSESATVFNIDTAFSFTPTIDPVIAALGPPRDSLSTVIPMTLVYSILLLTGVIGNICTCIVIARNRYMHTATNYYLFSLAVSDLLLLILGLPQELYQLWQRYPYALGESVCVLRGLTSETSTNASILTITAFTIERYVAICHPLRAHTMSKLSRAVKFVLIIWLLSAICAVPIALQFGIEYQPNKDGSGSVAETAQCTLTSPLHHAFEVTTFLFFLLPMSVILVLYILIAVQLKRSSELGRRQDSERKSNSPPPAVGSWNETKQTSASISTPDNSTVESTAISVSNGRSMRSTTCVIRRSKHQVSSSSRKAVVNMLVAVVVAFFLCWAPFHAQRLMAVYIEEPTELEILAFNALTYISGVTYYVSATINPILYSIMSLKFRQAFRDTLLRCCCRNTARRRNRYGGKSTTFNTDDYMSSQFYSCARAGQRRSTMLTSDFTLLLPHERRPSLPAFMANSLPSSPPSYSTVINAANNDKDNKTLRKEIAIKMQRQDSNTSSSTYCSSTTPSTTESSVSCKRKLFRRDSSLSNASLKEMMTLEALQEVAERLSDCGINT